MTQRFSPRHRVAAEKILKPAVAAVDAALHRLEQGTGSETQLALAKAWLDQAAMQFFETTGLPRPRLTIFDDTLPLEVDDDEPLLPEPSAEDPPQW